YCYAATIRIYNGEFQVLEKMKALRDNPPARAGQGDIKLLQSFYIAGRAYQSFYGRGNMEETIRFGETALALLPPGHDAMASMFRFLVSLALRFTGDPGRARQFTLEPGGNNGVVSAMAAMNQTSLEFEMGNLKTAKAVIQREMDAMAREFGDPPPGIYGLLFIYRGVALMEENRMEEAGLAFNKGMAAVENTIFTELSIIAHGEYAIYLAEARAFDRAHQSIDLAIALSARTGSWLVAYNQAIKQLIFLRQDCRPPVEAWMEENPVPQGEIPYQKTYDCLIHIRHALALDAPRPQPALALLEKLIQSDRAQARNGRLLTTWVLKARALFLAHAPGKAVKALEQALALAAPQGYVRIFVSELADLTRHLPRIQKTIQGAQLPPDFARALEDGLTQRPCRVPIHDMVEEFNTREIAILKLFGRGL
ncbi:MAG: hypothetical protein MI747_15280, partial [Desulfobacterales bacterium]|nr:hypothetical protein [Desulfobacterales bacterium]